MTAPIFFTIYVTGIIVINVIAKYVNSKDYMNEMNYDCVGGKNGTNRLKIFTLSTMWPIPVLLIFGSIHCFFKGLVDIIGILIE